LSDSIVERSGISSSQPSNIWRFVMSSAIAPLPVFAFASKLCRITRPARTP
jgi:hypothetical protein